MQRLFMHWAAAKGVDLLPLLERGFELFDKRAFARAHRAHQVEHLAGFLTAKTCRVEVLDDLFDRLFYSEKLVLEEVVNTNFLAVNVSDANLFFWVQGLVAIPADHFVDSLVGELWSGGVFFDKLEVIQKRALELFFSFALPIFLDEILKVHAYSPYVLVVRYPRADPAWPCT
jgi:hypothetical protein